MPSTSTPRDRVAHAVTFLVILVGVSDTFGQNDDEPALAADGWQCSSNRQCANNDCEGGICCNSGGRSRGCTSCNGGGGSCSDCSNRYHLSNGRCSRRRGDGSSCSSRNTCQSRSCKGGRCCNGNGQHGACAGCASNGDCASCNAPWLLSGGRCVPNHGADCSAAGECAADVCRGKCCQDTVFAAGRTCETCSNTGMCETCFPNSYWENGYCNVAGGVGTACSGGEHDTCSNDIVCRGGTCCDRAVASDCTTCSGVNGRCLDCNAGLVSTVPGGPGLCRPELGPGEQCEYDTQCRVNGVTTKCGGYCCVPAAGRDCVSCSAQTGACVQCNDQTYLEAGQCVSRKAPGTICASSDECLGNGGCRGDTDTAENAELSGIVFTRRCCANSVIESCGSCDASGSCSECDVLHKWAPDGSGLCVERTQSGQLCDIDVDCQSGSCREAFNGRGMSVCCQYRDDFCSLCTPIDGACFFCRAGYFVHPVMELCMPERVTPNGGACDTNETCGFGDCVGGGCCSAVTSDLDPHCTSCRNSTTGDCIACSAPYAVEGGQCTLPHVVPPSPFQSTSVGSSIGSTVAPATPVPTPGGVAESTAATLTQPATLLVDATVPNEATMAPKASVIDTSAEPDPGMPTGAIVAVVVALVIIVGLGAVVTRRGRAAAAKGPPSTVPQTANPGAASSRPARTAQMPGASATYDSLEPADFYSTRPGPAKAAYTMPSGVTGSRSGAIDSNPVYADQLATFVAGDGAYDMPLSVDQPTLSAGAHNPASPMYSQPNTGKPRKKRSQPRVSTEDALPEGYGVPPDRGNPQAMYAIPLAYGASGDTGAYVYANGDGGQRDARVVGAVLASDC